MRGLQSLKPLKPESGGWQKRHSDRVGVSPVVVSEAPISEPPASPTSGSHRDPVPWLPDVLGLPPSLWIRPHLSLPMISPSSLSQAPAPICFHLPQTLHRPEDPVSLLEALPSPPCTAGLAPTLLLDPCP